MRRVSVGWHLSGAVQQPTQISQPVDNGDSGPSRITRSIRNPQTPIMRGRQYSVLSELGGDTQPDAMRQIGGMVRIIPPKKGRR
jgi:hypothetical protein